MSVVRAGHSLPYRVHKRQSLFPVRSRLNPVNTLPTDLFMYHSKTIPYLRIGLPSVLFLSGFPIKTMYAPLLPIRATCPTHLDLLDLITWTMCPYRRLLIRKSVTFPAEAPVGCPDSSAGYQKNWWRVELPRSAVTAELCASCSLTLLLTALTATSPR
jgi:hypothetical protein